MTKIDICNHALLKIGASNIASLDTDSNTDNATIQSAKLCNIFFEQALEEVLRTYKWNSALKRKKLSRLTEIPDFKFKYKYQLPNDYIRVINIYDNKDGIDNKIQFVVEGKQILCDHEEIYLSYVARVEDVNSLNAFATQCVIQNLAIKLSVPMQLDQDMQNNLITEYNEVILPNAKSIDTQENRYWEMEESDTLLSIYKTSPMI